MVLSTFRRDIVDLLKKDGTKKEGLKASVQTTQLFLDSGDFLVETGDFFIRHMSNGGQETYEVLDPGFHEAFHGIKPHYQMMVRKLGIPEASRAAQSITFNINGNNARVNQNSIDNSSNTGNVDARAVTYINELKSAISAAPISESEKISAIEAAEGIQEQFESGKPKKSIVTALLNSLPHVESVTAIAATISGLFS